MVPLYHGMVGFEPIYA
ncbi:hypothetical protein E2C01_090685 [Portunus trituberculatus]|uniref:Uncharacterized protein n=1 Tax=Portunus trituberculatus TaxID=210409 RepID=A0A5B7JBZ1_PORTR|nr:hypothetical protein [Portunus trituberculatus]